MHDINIIQDNVGKKAFTLVEILVGILIFSLVIIG
jgi:prepilin-type N-terminal cleavage/methylation domain-containing protein